ncbi:MAG: hypothetical protein V7749_04505 [Cocleimonas sp.]
MIRFLFGILLVQIATVILVLLAPELQGIGWLRLFIPLLVIGFFAAFWLASMAKHKTKDEVNVATAEHAREKEKLQLNAERAKTRLVKKTQQQIARESTIAHSKANFKVGAAFAGTIGFGALMLLTELITLGLLTMSTAGGALGGYLWRAKKGDKRLAQYDGNKLIDGAIKVIKEK